MNRSSNSTVLAPPVEVSTTEAPKAISAGGGSWLGSPWAKPPPTVAMLRIRGVDREEDEVALVRSAAELDPASRKALEEELVLAGFVLRVDRILAIEEEIEIRSWRVVTQQGPRSFQTPRDEWPREAPGGGLLVRDVAGDLYRIEKPHELDARSQRCLWAFVD